MKRFAWALAVIAALGLILIVALIFRQRGVDREGNERSVVSLRAAPAESRKPAVTSQGNAARGVAVDGAQRQPTPQRETTLDGSRPRNALLIDSDGKISADAKTYLGLSEPEVTQLQAVLRAVERQMIQLDVKHTRLEISDDRSKIIAVVEAYPEEGGRLYDAMQDSIKAILGPERFRRYQAVVVIPRDSDLSNLGLWRKTFDVVKAHPSASGKPVEYAVEGTFTGPIEIPSTGGVEDVVHRRSTATLARSDLARLYVSLPHLLPGWF